MGRDDEISIVEVDGLVFNGREYSEIHVSLEHINFDSKGNRRSSFTIEEVITLFADAVNGAFLEEDGNKANVSYYVYQYESVDKRKYKIVFYTENNQLFIRLITLYRTRFL